MLKVTNESCSVVDAFSREIKECYANYNENAEDRTTFGDGEAWVFLNFKLIHKGNKARNR